MSAVATAASPDWKEYRGMRVLVTGGLGFVGSGVARALDTAGAHVVVLDDGFTGKPKNLPAQTALRSSPAR